MGIGKVGEGSYDIPDKDKIKLDQVGRMTLKKTVGGVSQILHEVKVEVCKRPTKDDSLLKRASYEVSRFINNLFPYTRWKVIESAGNDVWINRRSEQRSSDVGDLFATVRGSELTSAKTVHPLTKDEVIALKMRLDAEKVTVVKDAEVLFADFKGNHTITHITVGEYGKGAFKQVDKVFSRELNKIIAFAKPRADLKETDKKTTQRDLIKESKYSKRFQEKGIKVVQYHKIVQEEKAVTGALLEPCTEGDLEKNYYEKSRDPKVTQEGYQMLAQTCRELLKIHNLNYVHRDIKPANILMTKNDKGEKEVRIGDLGMVASVADPFDVCGTPDYIAPELMSGDATDNDPRQDVWSFGVMLYEFATGKSILEKGSWNKIEQASNADDQMAVEDIYDKLLSGINWDDVQDKELRKLLKEDFLVIEPLQRKFLSEEAAQILDRLGVGKTIT